MLVIIEFKDELDPYQTNNNKQNVMVQTIIFMPIDSRVDDSKCTFLITIDYKGKSNNKSNNYCIKRLKEIYSPNNEYKFFYKNSNKYVKVSIFLSTIVIDIIKKEPYSNFLGGKKAILI